MKDAKDSFSALGASVKGPVVSAFNGLKGAIGATGIGLLVIGISLLIINFDKVKQAVLNFIPGLAKVGEFIGNLVNGITDFIGLTSEAERAAGRLNAASQKNLKTSQDELEVLKARGATADVIYKKERDQSQQRINDLNEIQKLNKTLTEDELKERTELIQKIKVLDAGEAKRKEDDAKKASDEADKRAKEQADKANQRRKERQDLIEKERLFFLNARNSELEAAKIAYEADLKEYGRLNLSKTKLNEKFRIDVSNINKKYDDEILAKSRELSERTISFNKSKYDKELIDLENAKNAELKAQDEFAKNSSQTTEITEKNKLAIISFYQQRATEVQFNSLQEGFNDLQQFAELEFDLYNVNNNRQVAEAIKTNKGVTEALEAATKKQKEVIADSIANQIDGNDRLLAITKKNLILGFEAAFKADKDNLELAFNNLDEKGKLSDADLALVNENTKKQLKLTEDLTKEERKILKDSYLEQQKISEDGLKLDIENAFKALKEKQDAEIRFNAESKSLDAQNSADRLSIDNAYYTELKKAQDEFGTDYERFANFKTLLDKKAAQDQLKVQIKLIEDKIKIAKTDPSLDPEKVKGLEAELLKLRSQSAAAEIDIEKQKVAEKLALQQKVTEEINALLAESGALISDLFALEIQKQTKHYDDLLQANEDYYNKLSEQNTEALNAEINDYSLTAEEKTNIQEEYALREYEIRKKQAEEDKRLEAEKNEELKQLKKKQARIDFTIQIAQIIGNTALAISSAIAASPLTFGLPWSAVNAVTGGIQVAAAIAQLAQVESLEQGGLLKGKSHAQGGIPIGNTGIEVEGGEAVINKRSTAMYAPLLSAINMAGGGRPITPNFTSSMALGGQMIFDQNSITQAIQDGMQSGQINRAYILSSDVQSDIVKNNRIRRQASF